ncbi:hypothetical protein D3C72_1417360 [compost metagenome]
MKGAFAAQCLGQCLLLEHLGALALKGMVHHALGVANGFGRGTGKALGKGNGIGKHILARHPVGHAQLLRLFGTHHAGGKGQFLGGLQAHQARQQMHGAQVWHEADLGKYAAELGAGRSQHEIACQGQ